MRRKLLPFFELLFHSSPRAMPRSYSTVLSHRCFSPRGLLTTCFVLLMAAVELLAASVATAQYESDPVDEAARRYGGSRARRYVREPSSDPAEQAAFGKYIKDFELASMTQPDPASLAELSKMREDFLRTYLRGANVAPEVRRGLTQLTFQETGKIIKSGRYHPAVTYNAILLMGSLDEQYGDNPTPLPAANSILNKAVAAGLKSGRLPAPLIVGSLVGLERHTKSFDQLSSEAQADTQNSMLAVIRQDEFPQDISSSVSQWIKVIAVRGLANIGNLGQDNQVHTALMELIKDNDWRLNNRCRVAEALAKLRPAYESASGIDEQKTVASLLQLATDIASDEEERALEFEEDYRGGSGGGQRLYGLDESNIPSEYQVRRLVLRLSSLEQGINAVRPAIKDQRLAGLLADVSEAVGPVLSAAKEPNVIELTLTPKVKSLARTVADTTAALGVEAVEAPPESDEEAAEEMMEEGAGEEAETPQA